MDSEAKQIFKEVSISAVVTRLDGTQEDLGTIAKTIFTEDGKAADEVGSVRIEQPRNFLKKVLKKWRP